MNDAPTPGEVAYEAYAAHMPRVPVVTYIPPYGLLEVEQRMAWEAAAQAVLMMPRAHACRHCQGEVWHASCVFCAGSGQEDAP
jgi:hypothetical protein